MSNELSTDQERLKSEEIQLVIFSLGGEEFGVEITEVHHIEKMEEITRIPNSASYILGVINLRGKIIVVIDLNDRFGLTRKEADEQTRIIVVEVNGNVMGVIVDSVTEVLRLPLGMVKKPPAVVTERIDASYLRGVGILNDERLLILVDLEKVLGEEELEHVGKIMENIDSSLSKAPEETKKDQEPKPEPSEGGAADPKESKKAAKAPTKK